MMGKQTEQRKKEEDNKMTQNEEKSQGLVCKWKANLNQWDITNKKNKAKSKDQHKVVHDDDEWKVLIEQLEHMEPTFVMKKEILKTKGNKNHIS